MNRQYWTLRLRMLGRTLLYCALAYVGVLLFTAYIIDGVLQDPAATLLDEIGLYRWAQNNKGGLILFLQITVLLAAAYAASGETAVRLEQVERTAGGMLSTSSEPIMLPPDIRPIEMKLNTVKNELQHREYRAKESEQRKNDLVVYLAHDLKTPLTSVIGYLALLDEAKDLPAAQRERYTQVAYDKALKLEELLGELFEATRFNAQNMELVLRSVNLQVLLKQLTEEFHPLLCERKLSCTVECPQALMLVADPDQLARVFDNLLHNAVWYSEAGSEIMIRVSEQKTDVCIEFVNYGATIPPERLERVFERFYRADESRCSAGGGAGLGLAIAKEIVELHGGSITAQSADLRTVFTASLPLSKNF